MGRPLPKMFRTFSKQDALGLGPEVSKHLLVQLLLHCRLNVPYYSDLIGSDRAFQDSPEAYLLKLPILTKDTIRKNFEALQTNDLSSRRWYYNTSGGSTGEPVRFIQDQEYHDKARAIAYLYQTWTGWEIGRSELRLWGSEKEIFNETTGMRQRMSNWFAGMSCLNAFCMSPERMRSYIEVINRMQPRLIVAYAQAIYELALFSERQGIPVTPQAAIMTSAGTLYPFMRQKIESVFGCSVYNCYGSREVSSLACQCSVNKGLHVAPWGSYIEVVDDFGRPVPPGTEGNIVVTCLTNFAMPLVRYSIGDRGLLSKEACPCGRKGQVLEHVLGRNVDVFRARDGTLIDGEYFTHLLYHRDWLWKFQVVQTGYSEVVFKFVSSASAAPTADLDEIRAKTQLLMGPDCKVKFEFLPEIQPASSGKYRYTISEVLA
jgi:phenylacetate-CoA ligase